MTWVQKLLVHGSVKQGISVPEASSTLAVYPCVTCAVCTNQNVLCAECVHVACFTFMASPPCHQHRRVFFLAVVIAPLAMPCHVIFTQSDRRRFGTATPRTCTP